MVTGPADRPRFRRALHALTAVGFSGFVAAGLASLRPDDPPHALLAAQNRTPAPLPAPTRVLDDARAWTRDFEAWFDDRLTLRDPLVRVRHELDLRVLSISPSPMLVLGEAGWMYFAGEDSIAGFRGTQPFSRAELDAWVDSLSARDRWCRERGLRFVFAIAPNKEEVYPEHFPARFTQVGPTRLDQLSAELARRTEVTFVDLREALRAESAHDAEDDHVYFRLGTHWTARGAWAAARALFAALGTVPAALARELYAARVDADAPQDSMGDRLHLETPLAEPIHAFEPAAGWSWTTNDAGSDLPRSTRAWTGGDAAGPSLVLIHDSFGPWLAPFLAQSARRVVASPSTPRATSVIAHARPDVVLQVYTERVLQRPQMPRAVWGELDRSPEPVAPPIATWRNGAELAAGLHDARGSAAGATPTDARVAADGALEVDAGDTPLTWPLPPETARRDATLTLDVEAQHVARLEVATGVDARVTTLLAPGRETVRVTLGRVPADGRLVLNFEPGRYRVRSIILDYTGAR
jgi:hypothetical protein